MYKRRMETSTHKNTQPKILVVSGYTPPATNGSGLMMFNLLSQFPAHSLALVTEGLDTNPAIAHLVLPAPYYTYGDSLTSFDIKKEAKTALGTLKNILKKIPVIKTISSFLFLVYLVRKIVNKGLEAVEKESPTMLVGYSDVGANLIATYILHKKTGIPFSLFFYDMYKGNKLAFPFRVAAYFFEPKLLKEAKHIFVMCDPLQEHYQKKYNRNDITIIYNSLLPENSTAQEKEISLTTRDTLRIAYLGNIYWAQEQALLNLVKAIKEITEIPVALTIYTYNPKEHLSKLGIHEDTTTHITKCLPEEVSQVLTMSDIAFVGLSFDTQYPLLINTSSPGRLCDFLRSNTPILIHSPKNSFISMYAKKNNFAYVVDENNVEKLKQEILTIATSKEESLRKVKNAHITYEKNHNARHNAVLYYNILTS